MNQCPKCKRYMEFHMYYSYGICGAYYTCVCGYDTRKDIPTWSTTTDFVPQYKLKYEV